MKNKIRAIIPMLLCAIFIGAAFVPCISVFADGREIIASDTYWTLYDDGELCVFGKTTLSDTPSWTDHCEKIKKLTIGKDVFFSGVFDFYFSKTTGYPNLETISVEEGNKSLSTDENNILYDLDKTKILLYPNTLEATEFYIPDSVTTVMDGAFFGNNTIKKISGGKNLKTVETWAFTCMRALEEVTLSDSVTYMGWYAFSDCPALKTVVTGSNVEKIPSDAFSGCTSLENLTIKNASEISSYAFKNCTSLKNVVLPEGVRSIDTGAFSGCSSLTSVTLPSTLTIFKLEAFKGCKNIENVYFNGDEYDWCRMVINGSDSTPLQYAENFYIKGKPVTDFVVPSGITAIPSLLFKNYSKLKSVTISDTVTQIGSSAFEDCGNLETVVFPDSLKSIGRNAFSSCTNLEKLELPRNLEYIGQNAFAYSGYYNDYANWDNGFLYCGKYLLFADKTKVPADCVLYSKTELIASHAFYSCDHLTSVVINDGVKYINDNVFYGKKNLTSVIIPEGVKSIGVSAFEGCSSLESVIIPESVETLGKNAFNCCTSLSATEIPGTIKTIGEKTFANCTNLSEITINEGVEIIKDYAFSNNDALSEVHLPSTVTVLASNAFSSGGVTDIYFGGSKADWKRAIGGKTVDGITVHYTLRSDDGSVIINHTDDNFDYESGNVHLVVEDLKNAVSHYEQNGFYTVLMVKPIQVLDIKLVDGDGNPIQPLHDESITVKIRASEDFMNLLKSELKAVSGYDVDAEKIGFAESCLLFERDGETVSVQPSKVFLDKIKIIHWYSDAVGPKDHTRFTHDKITVENGYIIIETNHFSEYAVCTDITEPEDFTVRWVVDGVATEQTVTEGDALSAPENPVKEGHTFIGWSPEVPEKMPAKNLEFTAQWQVNEYTITFDTAGGSGIDPMTLEYGAAITAPASPEKAGYAFIGWSPEIPATMPAENITVVAQYKKAETPENPENPAAKVTGIKIISLPNKTKYAYKVDSLDLNGIAVKLNYSDGSSKIITDTGLLKAYGFNVGTVGTKTVTVSYGGFTDDFEITVSYTWWQMIIRILLLGFIWY